MANLDQNKYIVLKLDGVHAQTTQGMTVETFPTEEEAKMKCQKLIERNPQSVFGWFVLRGRFEPSAMPYQIVIGDRK